MRPPHLSSSALAALVLLLFTSVASAASAVLGIDLGQEYIKAALVKPGIPLEIVLTKDTKRKEASAIGFKPSSSPAEEGEFNYPERLYGADALNLAGRFPHDVYPNLKQLLGKLVTDDEVAKYSSRYSALNILPSSGRNTVAFKTKSAPTESGTFTVEELLAMQLKAVLAQAQVLAGPSAGQIRDAVFTIPAFFTSEEKHALTLAAELAGLKVMGFVTDGLAVGLNYATSRTFDEKEPEYHIVYDMGAGSTTASVLKFQGKSVKDVGRFNKTIQEISVLGVGYDRTLGGDLFNEKIFDIFVTDFIEGKGKKALANEADPRKAVTSNGRAAAKLWKESTRVRQILSANSETLGSVESLYEDIDFRSSKITRAQYEEAIAEYGSRITDPIFDALSKSKISLDQIKSLILHGGASRTPFVGKKLEEVMGGSDKISKNVNSDEAAVFGATFKGAGESGSFKVKEIRTNDINPYAVSVRHRKDESTEKQITQQIFPAGSAIGKEKIIGFPRLTDFTFNLLHSLDPKKDAVEAISSITVQNLTESAKKLQDTAGCGEKEILTKFAMSLNKKDGLPIVSKGWVECEVEVVEEVKKDGEGVMDGVKDFFGFGKKKDGDQKVLEEVDTDSTEASTETSTSSSTSTQSETSSSETPAASTAVETEKKLVKRTEKIPLQFTITKDGIAEAPAEYKKELIAKIKGFDSADNARRKLEEARNELEAFTYKARELLHADDFIAASTEEARESLSALLDEAGEWLYGDGFHAPLAEVRQKLKALKDIQQPILKRRDEALKRPDQIKQLKDTLDQAKNLLSVLKQSGAKASEAASAETAAEASTTAVPEDDAFASLEEEVEFSSTTTTSELPTPTPVLFTPEELDELTSSYEAVEKWLESKIEEQEKLKPHEDPVLSVKDIEGKLRDMNQLLVRTLQKQMKNQTPPKPKSTKSSSKKSTSTTSSSTSATAETSSTSSAEAETTTKHDEL